MRRSLDCGDLDGAGREAHTLLGTAGNFGAMRLSGLAAELRAACDAGNARLARDIADGLDRRIGCDLGGDSRLVERQGGAARGLIDPRDGSAVRDETG